MCRIVFQISIKNYIICFLAELVYTRYTENRIVTYLKFSESEQVLAQLSIATKERSRV